MEKNQVNGKEMEAGTIVNAEVSSSGNTSESGTSTSGEDDREDLYNEPVVEGGLTILSKGVGDAGDRVSSEVSDSNNDTDDDQTSSTMTFRPRYLRKSSEVPLHVQKFKSPTLTKNLIKAF